MSLAAPSPSGVHSLAPVYSHAAKAALKPTPWVRVLPTMALGPLFLALLITRVSGVPPTDAQRDKKYGQNAAYRKWRAEVPAVFPKFGLWGGFAAEGAAGAVGDAVTSPSPAEGAVHVAGGSRGSPMNFKRKFRGSETGPGAQGSGGSAEES